MQKKTEEALKRLAVQDETIKRLESQVVTNQILHSQVAVLTNELAAKKDELDKLKMEHATVLLNVVDETKKKMWCLICGNHLEKSFHGLHVCSAQCLQTMW